MAPAADARPNIAPAAVARDAEPAVVSAGPRKHPVGVVRRKRHVSAWQVGWDNAAGIASFAAAADSYHTISPFWFELDRRGHVFELDGVDDASLLAAGRDTGVPVVPTISNGFSSDRAHRVLRTSATRERHARLLASLVRSRGYDGIDIDYENVYFADRHRYTDFISRLARNLHADHHLLTVAAMAKTSDRATGAPGAIDWPKVGALVDEFRVMGYDYHWSGGSPGPIAPSWWVQQVVDHAVDVMPAHRVWLGVPLYGYDWPAGHSATSLTWQGATALAAAKGAAVHWSTRDGAAWFRYTSHGRRHEVWFSDQRSVDVQAGIAQQAHLGGVIAWRIGHEDPAWWTVAAAHWPAGPQPR